LPVEAEDQLQAGLEFELKIFGLQEADRNLSIGLQLFDRQAADSQPMIKRWDTSSQFG